VVAEVALAPVVADVAVERPQFLPARLFVARMVSRT
jgi:hypothetical protein